MFFFSLFSSLNFNGNVMWIFKLRGQSYYVYPHWSVNLSVCGKNAKILEIYLKLYMACAILSKLWDRASRDRFVGRSVGMSICRWKILTFFDIEVS